MEAKTLLLKGLCVFTNPTCRVAQLIAAGVLVLAPFEDKATGNQNP